MTNQRVIGMTINHSEIELILQQMADVLRNAAYQVCKERYPNHPDYFDETGTLIVMDELSIKSILKDALEHYLMFSATASQHGNSDFNYYLQDSFQMVAAYINADQHKLSFLCCLFARACGALAGSLAPVINDLSSSGQGVEKVESFALNTDESYYLVFGENFIPTESYDPKDDDLSTVVTNDTPEQLAAWEVKKRQLQDAEKFTDYVDELGKCVDKAIANGEFPSKSFRFKSTPFHPHISNYQMKIDTSVVDEFLDGGKLHWGQQTIYPAGIELK